MKFYCFILLAYLLISIKVFSQSDFRPAYYITLQHDTIFGLIDFKGDMRSSKICAFKKDAEAQLEKFEPDDILAYRFINDKYYVSKSIKKENEQIQVFVEFLVDGISNLYYYRDFDNEHYYIENKDGQLFELTEETKTIDDEKRGIVQVESKKYIGLLKITFADCKEILKQVDKAELNRKSLIDITKKYHNYVCDGEKCIVYEKELPTAKIHFLPIVGIEFSKLTFDESSAFAALKFDNCKFPILGLLVKSSLFRFSHNYSFQSGLIYSKHFYNAYSKINNSVTDFGLYAYYLKNPIGIGYTNHKLKIKPFIKAGLYNTLVLRSNSQMFETTIGNTFIEIKVNKEVDTKFYQFSYYAGIGLQYDLSRRNSIIFEFQYEKGQNLLGGQITNYTIQAGLSF